MSASLSYAPADETRQPSGIQAALAQRDAVNVILHPDGSAEVAAPANDEEPEGPPTTGYLRHDFDENLALHLTDTELSNLAAEIQRGIDSDTNDRRDWDEIAAMAVDYLGLKVLRETGANDEAGSSLSKIWDPLIAEATVAFWANAVAEFLPADGPCKVRDDAPPPVAVGQGPGAGMGDNGGPPLVEAPPPGNGQLSRDDLAQAFEKDMNHYLTKGDRSYYRDFSRMLLNLGPTGTQFRKVYWCPLRGKPVSEWVRASDLIVSSDATDLSTAARVTQLIKMSQARAARLQRSGWWRRCELGTPIETQTETEKEIGEAQGIQRQPVITSDYLHTFEECYTEVDLPGFEHTEDDEDAEDYGERTYMPLPYRIVLEKTSRQIVEIRRNWRQDDPLFHARQRYVFFGMIPGLGFYAMGFMHLLGNGELTLTSIGRQLLDAGQYANFPGFLMRKGMSSQVTTDIMIQPGEAKEIDTGNSPIGDAVMPLPYKEPSQVLAALASALAERFQKLAGAAQVPVGEGTAQVPVGTIIAMIEQSTKMMAAVHKGLHASRAEELEMLRELIAEDPSVLSRGNKRAARQWEQAEEFTDLDLVPSSDPNVPSQLHRIMQATALAQMAQTAPGVLDPKWVIENVCRTIGKELPPEAFLPPQAAQPPPVDPAKMLLAQAAAQNAQTNAAKLQTGVSAAQAETQRKAAEAVTQAENDRQSAALNAGQTADKLQSQERIAQMREETERARLALETGKALHGASLAERQHQLAASQPPGGGIAPRQTPGAV